LYPKGTEILENFLAGLMWILTLAVNFQGELRFARRPVPKEDYALRRINGCAEEPEGWQGMTQLEK